MSPSAGERAGLDLGDQVIDSFEDAEQDMIRECVDDPIFFFRKEVRSAKQDYYMVQGLRL